MTSTAQARSALIIPALNEAPVIGKTLDAIPRGLYRMVIVADNGSTDRTAEIARSRGAFVVEERKRGYGAACLRAIAALPREIETIVFMQADLSEDPREAAALMAPIWEGRADLVIGSRTLGSAQPGSLSARQRFGNWLATTLIRLLYGFRYTDLGPYRAISAKALRRLKMQDRNYGWTVEMQVRAVECGLNILEVPVSYAPRAAGVNKISGDLKASLRAGAVILSTIWRLRRQAKLRAPAKAAPRP